MCSKTIHTIHPTSVHSHATAAYAQTRREKKRSTASRASSARVASFGGLRRSACAAEAWSGVPGSSRGRQGGSG